MKRLEDEGIGRPSTYASIIKTILRPRLRVPARQGAGPELHRVRGDRACCGRTSPTTSTSASPRRWRRTSTRSPAASGRRSTSSASSIAARNGRPGLEQRAQSDDQIPYPAVDVGTDPETDLPIRVRIGRFGPFLARGEGGDGHTASLPDEVAPADFTVDQAVDLLNAKAEGPRSLGVHPATGEKVYLLTGRYGPYVQLGEMPEKGAKGAKAPKPKRASLPKTLFSESTLTLDQALQLLGLPREVGLHPDDGKPIVANFGPLLAVREAQHRLPLARFGSGGVRGHARSGRRAVPAAEAEPPAERLAHRAERARREARHREGDAGAVGPLRSRTSPTGRRTRRCRRAPTRRRSPSPRRRNCSRRGKRMGPPQKKGARKGAGGARRPAARKSAPRKGA